MSRPDEEDLRFIFNVVNNLSREGGKSASKQKLVQILTLNGFSQETINASLEKLKEEDRITEVDYGKYRAK